jgi:hypothetical protein
MAYDDTETSPQGQIIAERRWQLAELKQLARTRTILKWKGWEKLYRY